MIILDGRKTSSDIKDEIFKFKRWEENIKLVFRKNHEYFQKDSIGNSLVPSPKSNV